MAWPTPPTAAQAGVAEQSFISVDTNVMIYKSATMVLCYKHLAAKFTEYLRILNIQSLNFTKFKMKRETH